MHIVDVYFVIASNKRRGRAGWGDVGYGYEYRAVEGEVEMHEEERGGEERGREDRNVYHHSNYFSQSTFR